MIYEPQSDPNFHPTNESFIPGDYERLEAMTGRPWAEVTTLDPRTEYTIDDYPLDRDPSTGANVAAVIVADRNTDPSSADYQYGTDKPDTFVLFDLRNQPRVHDGRQSWRKFAGELFSDDVDYLLVNRNFDPSQGLDKGFKGIRRGETIDVGRRNEAINSRFGLQDTTSGKHFKLTYDQSGKLTITDQGSTNGTRVFAGTPLVSSAEAAHGRQHGRQGVEEDLLDGNAHIFNVRDVYEAARLRAEQQRAEEARRRAALSYERFEAAAYIAGSKRSKLPPKQPCLIDVSKPLAVDPETGGAVAAVIVADKSMKPGEAYSSIHFNSLGEPTPSQPDAFVLLDLRGLPTQAGEDGTLSRMLGTKRYATDVDFLLINKDWRFEAAGIGFKGIRKGETLEIGQLNQTARHRFSLKGSTASEHFRLTYTEDGAMVIEDLGSAQGTSITTAENLRKVPSRTPPAEAPKNPAFDRLAKAFANELKDSVVTEDELRGVLAEVDGLRAGKVAPKVAYRQLARKYHPDILAKDAPVNSPEYRHAQALQQAIAHLIPDSIRKENAW